MTLMSADMPKSCSLKPWGAGCMDRGKVQSIRTACQGGTGQSMGKFQISMTIIDKADYDPINPFWCPVCEEDLKPPKRQRSHNYLSHGRRHRMSELHGAGKGISNRPGDRTAAMLPHHEAGAVSDMYGKTVYTFHTKPCPVADCADRTPRAFLIWCRTNRFPIRHSLCFSGGLGVLCAAGYHTTLEYAGKGTQSQEFRHPCIDEVVYEHVYYVGSTGTIQTAVW